MNPTQGMTRNLKKFRDVEPDTCGAGHATLGSVCTSPGVPRLRHGKRHSTSASNPPQ